ncbi:MAG: DUF4954 family protein [Bacteroidales bacterium]|nr:DUF4954 family protein [Bacteroidales bacterium]
MEKVTVMPPDRLVNGWINPKYIPEGKDKYYIRNNQVKVPKGGWRHLRSDEIATLVRANNTAGSWDQIWVTDEFDALHIKNNSFMGTVRIGRVTENGLQFHDLRLPIGITNSTIHSCDIGNDCAIHDVHYLSHYIIGDRCMLFNIHEMSSTDHSKFGNGIVKEGESESVRVKLSIMNEAETRQIYPFDGMITADAYLWAKYIDDAGLQKKLAEITQNGFDARRGYYGTVGEGCVIKTSQIIKDVKIGPACYIKGASKLKNITINSNEKEPSQIGENTILVNGIVGYGSRIFYGCTAVKFVVGNNCSLKYGARVIDSVLGDNSTISCCEVLNNLIFPAHEQHHNNSFLIASVVMGQSNMAAGATVGSNHNSRAADNELVAGRGFWPGLCVSLKHPSVFASYTLLSKGAFPYELNIKLPFSMVINDEKEAELKIIPAFWWLYNMYALCRNNWKFLNRDKRITKVQNIEFSTFAPDSMEEVIAARKLLEIWTAKAWYRKEGVDFSLFDEKMMRAKGYEILNGDPEVIDSLEILGEGMEKSKRPVRIIKAAKAYKGYGDMLVHYAMTNVMDYLEKNPSETLLSVSGQFRMRRHREWINMGGQLMMTSDVDRLRADIREGRLTSWKEIHKRYNDLWKRYPYDKLRHAFLSLCYVMKLDSITEADWRRVIDREIEIQEFMCEQVYLSRKKDYDSNFRKATYRNEEEMLTGMGTIEDNDFVKMTRETTKRTIETLNALRP